MHFLGKFFATFRTLFRALFVYVVDAPVDNYRNDLDTLLLSEISFILVPYCRWKHHRP